MNQKVREQNIKKNQDEFFFPSNSFAQKAKRTTIEIDKNSLSQRKLGENFPTKTNISGIPRSKRNIAFTGAPFNLDSPDLKEETDNEYLFTQKELGQ